MVRDAYAAGGQPQLADGSGSTANLTQELAQLLAQSIAQGQSGRRPPGAAATGSELASLAALVSASQNQRQPYKDGLSALSYARPAHSPPPAITPVLASVPAPAASGMLIAEPHHDDEPRSELAPAVRGVRPQPAMAVFAKRLEDVRVAVHGAVVIVIQGARRVQQQAVMGREKRVPSGLSSRGVGCVEKSSELLWRSIGHLTCSRSLWGSLEATIC